MIGADQAALTGASEAAVPMPPPRFAGLRVADAPPVQSASRAQRRDGVLLLFQILLVMVLVHFSWFFKAPGLAAFDRVLVLARYGLWPCILAGAAWHLARRGPETLLRVLAPWLAYPLVGIVSGLLGVSVVESMRVLVFWSLGVLAAATVGLTLPPERTLRTLHATFVAFVLVSVVFVLVLPQLGLQANSRSETGFSWQGVFPGKNQLGEICAYSLLFGLLVPGISRGWRWAWMGLGWFALWQTNSQSALMLACVQIAYWLVVQRYRRLALPAWAKAAALAATLAGLALAVMLGKNVLLALLGRDATLTGRSDIWAMWLERALQHWLIGAGPGAFTMPGSTTTADLALAFQAYGSILTPHNMYIAVLGEVGVFGLVALIVPLTMMLVAVPFRHPDRAGLACGLVALTMAVGGIGETHEVFGAGLNMTLLVLCYAAAMVGTRQDTVASDLLVPTTGGRQEWHPARAAKE